MAEYIDRQAAMDACLNGWNLDEDTVSHIQDNLKRVPAADVVEVVRCKDCKYRKVNEHYGKKGYMWLKAMCTLDTGDPFELGRDAEDDNWFCADGEKREG